MELGSARAMRSSAYARRELRAAAAAVRGDPDSPLAQRLGRALAAAAEGPRDLSALRRLGSIERLRRRLHSSDVPVEVVDHGAGSPGARRTREEMDRGTPAVMTVGEISRSSGTNRAVARLLFHLIREFRPAGCVELGTSLGISAAYQAAALERNGAGHLLSFEGSARVAELARRHLTELRLAEWVEVRTGRFADLLAGLPADGERVDHAFVDGSHDEAATVEYFRTLSSKLRSPGVIVFDDIAWSHGMRRAWEMIRRDPAVLTQATVGELAGVVIIGPR